MVCSLPGSSVNGILQARTLEWVAIYLLQGIFLTQRSNLGLLHCRQILYHWAASEASMWAVIYYLSSHEAHVKSRETLGVKQIT